MAVLPPPPTFRLVQRRMPRYPTLPRSGNGVAFPRAIKAVGRPRQLGLVTPVRYGRLCRIAVATIWKYRLRDYTGKEGTMLWHEAVHHVRRKEHRMLL